MKKLFFCFVCVLAAVCIASCDTTSEDVVKVIDIKLTDEEYAFAVKKGNTELLNDFNTFLADIQESGKFNEIVAKYFETGLPTNAFAKRPIPIINAIATINAKTFKTFFFMVEHLSVLQVYLSKQFWETKGDVPFFVYFSLTDKRKPPLPYLI